MELEAFIALHFCNGFTVLGIAVIMAEREREKRSEARVATTPNSTNQNSNFPLHTEYREFPLLTQHTTQLFYIFIYYAFCHCSAMLKYPFCEQREFLCMHIILNTEMPFANIDIK